MSANTKPIGPFVGLNNRLPDHQLAVVERGRKAGDYLRNAINVDLTQAGTLLRRKGVEREVPGTDCHSLWGDEKGAFYVDGETLYAYPRTAIRTGLALGLPASFCRLPDGDVVWSNAVMIERIRAGASLPLALPVPNPSPTVVAAGGGSLHAGVYQISITAIGLDGEESGATWPVQVRVPDSGRIEVSGLPGTMVNIYLSPLNGDVLFLAATTTASSYVFPLMPALGPQLQSLGARALPAGQIVRYFKSRVLVAMGASLFMSEPYRYGLHNPMRDYVVFPEEIAVVAPTEGGVWVATRSKTYWLGGGNPSAADLVEVLPYGAVPRSETTIEGSRDVAWFSTRGIVIGSAQGEARNVQEDTVAVGKAASGATLYREQDGLRQLVSSLFGTETTGAAANGFFEADLVRKESML